MSDTRVRLSTSRFRLAFDGSGSFFDRVVAPVLAPLAPSGKPGRRPARPGAVASRRPESPGYRPPSDRFGMFERQFAPNEQVPTGLVAAYAFYLWNYEKKETFLEGEIEGCFRAAGREPPSDAAALYGELLSRRMLAPGAKDHSWRLTGKGRDFVRHHLLSA
jgi:hypothetical protein